jgi:asparagine synthase (glutamine-hydrolysing)
MINVHLSYNKGYKWFSENEIFVKGYIITSDDRLLKGKTLIDYFSGVHSFSDFQAKLQDANGLFTVLIKRKYSLWAAIDSARSFPLFYYHQKDFFVITDDPEQLQIDHIPLVLDEDNAIIFTYSGFVTQNKTLLKDVFQLIAGESLCYENGRLKKEFHTEFLTDTFFIQTRNELKEELKRILEQVRKRMIKILDGRPVVIPLSGGFDSRLAAYLLKKSNYPNVFCYTFGKKNNIELKNAKRTAEKLGYQFCFVNYEKYLNKSLACDPVFKKYVNFAANYCNRFAEQDYYAIRELLDSERIPKDAVFIPGHSGAIAGHLLSKAMDKKNFSFARHALEDVFSLVYPRKKDLRIIRKELEFLDNPEKEYPAYLVYENWRFQETTSLASNFSKIWDFFGFEYLFPLWDKELFDFFVHVPFQHKYDKNLYKETLAELFKEFNIHFQEEELYPSENLIKKVSFRSKLKRHFPFLKYFINIWKNDIIGSQYIAQGFIQELKESGNYRKMLSFNGISSAWYLMQVKKKLITKEQIS